MAIQDKLSRYGTKCYTELSATTWATSRIRVRHLLSPYKYDFKGFMPLSRALMPTSTRALCHMIKGLVPLCSRALCHHVKGFKLLWIKNMLYQVFMFKYGPKAVTRCIQNQATFVISAFTRLLIYVMFQVEHCFIMYYYSLSPAHSLLCLFL